MATLNITELNYIGSSDKGTPIQAGMLPALAIQNVGISAVAAASAAFTSRTNFIRLVSDVDCAIEVGADPDAVTTDMLLLAGIPEYFAVKPLLKISVIEV